MPQSLSRVLVHLVFSTHQRVPNLTEDVQVQLFPYLGGILRNLNSPAILVGGHDDHIHILFGLSRTLSIAQTVEKVKTASSGWIKEQFPLRKSFSWQAGYASVSVDSWDYDGVVDYILSQKEHHKKVSFMDEYRQMLELSGVEYDERYMWD
ncbi:MAG TPA: transposase [Fimbriimonadaceae bacterium]|jgi:REP element-mobilizing transposase RayT